ncbi:MAG: DEAD/DEAH box helicase [Gammaproteobacteria bacterium TMED1]|nr:MAG: DEAD/DEAH box helicase [Gammaproteobacteria bacterium TMED1]|tara:strand:- start:331 stop:2166 length:1836 start_codon:yes stop_codon:yes gene_type:complete
MSKKEMVSGFHSFGLPSPLNQALEEVGYKTPSPIQSSAIPPLLEGHDLLGHAPTGTGKTAAFALPLLVNIDISVRRQQALVLTPTRELAIQVAGAFERYAKFLKGFHVLPVYGGQEYSGQIRALRHGAHVVVGTPGRVKDHIRKGTMKLDNLRTLVLDEADEMLRMGFVEDVEWIMEQTPQNRQIALFSATMPKEIQKITNRFLVRPRDIRIKAKTATAESINQRYWLVSNLHKLDALTRILEVEAFDAVLLFVRTKVNTTELAGRLQARGYAAEALNGDMAQKSREQMIERLKKRSIDILVATDVAARGLDVDRISHVINYDIPYDAEAYIHRIGRTGRAGREGEAILFVSPRERRMLAIIEKATRKKIKAMTVPSIETVNGKRIANFKQSITDVLAGGSLKFIQGILESYELEHDVTAIEIAAGLAKLSFRDRPLLLKQEKKRSKGRTKAEPTVTASFDRKTKNTVDILKKARKGMELFRIEVGHDALVKPGNIIGAIASEAGLDAENIGHIDIRKKFSLIELPQGMPKAVFNDLKNVWVCGQKLDISKVKISRYSPTSPQNMPSGSNRVAKKIDALGTGCKKAKKRKKKVSSVKVKKNKMKREGSLKN